MLSRTAGHDSLSEDELEDVGPRNRFDQTLHDKNDVLRFTGYAQYSLCIELPDGVILPHVFD